MYWPQLSRELFTEQIISALRGETAPWSHYNRQLMVMGRGENAQRYQESDVTLRRYIEDKQETEPETVRSRLFLPYAALGHLKHVQGQKYPHLLGRKAKKQKQKQDHFPQVCLFYSNRAHSVSSGSGARPHGQRRATTDTQRCAT